jgi:hypothetical protein
MTLSRPTTLVFVISLVLAGLGLLSALGIFSIVAVSSFWMVAAGYGLLALGCLVRGM